MPLMTLDAQRNWLAAFIELYRSEPCLWKVKSKEYHDRSKKDAAYEKLVTKYRELDPEGNRESVIKKINNLRCAYKKEYKKVLATAGTDSVYEPKLWYYSLLKFLDEHDETRLSRSDSDTVNEIRTMKLSDVSSGSGTETFLPDDEWKLEYLTLKSSDSIDTSTIAAASNDSLLSWPHNVNSEAALTNNVLSVQKLNISGVSEDKFDAIGKLVALKLRSLSKEQALLAEKIINEAMFEAELGNLTTLHRVMAPNTAQEGSSARHAQRYCSLCDCGIDIPLPVLEYSHIPYNDI